MMKVDKILALVYNRKHQTDLIDLRCDEIFTYFSCCRQKKDEIKKKKRGRWKDARALGVVSFHGNSRVWKGLLAFAVPVVCNIHNWPGLMRWRFGNHNIAPPHPSAPHVTMMMLSSYGRCVTRISDCEVIDWQQGCTCRDSTIIPLFY